MVVTRRSFIVGGAAASLAACSKIDKTPQRVASMTDVDAKGARLFGSLELVALSTYQAAVAPGAVKLPAVLTNFANAALSHHQRALDQWNGALALSQVGAVSQPHPSLKATAAQGLAKVTDAKTFAKVALLIEQTLADSYQATLPKLQAKSAITLAGAFQVVDAEHVALLHFLLGEYPVPDDFQKGDHALST